MDLQRSGVEPLGYGSISQISCDTKAVAVAFAADDCRTRVRRLIGRSTLTTFAPFRTEGQTIYRTFKPPTRTAISGRAIGTSQYRRDRDQASRASEAHASRRHVSILTGSLGQMQYAYMGPYAFIEQFQSFDRMECFVPLCAVRYATFQPSPGPTS